MAKKRQWKMWAVVDREAPEDWAPELFFWRNMARTHAQTHGRRVIRVLVTEIPRRKKRK